jgi:hypothetical protein
VFSKSTLSAIAFAAASMPAVASATSGAADTIRSHLGLDYHPSCSLCHSSSRGGGAMVTRFGTALESRGFRVGDSASLESALDNLVGDGVDSDGDGVKDIDELLAATDPNSADNASIVGTSSPAGSGCAVNSHARGSGAWIAAVLAGATVLLGRRRACRPRPLDTR